MPRLLEQPLPLAFDQLLWSFIRRAENPKTETRRLLKWSGGATGEWDGKSRDRDGWPMAMPKVLAPDLVRIPCRWGEPGQLLYGQEAMEQDAAGLAVYAFDKAPVLWRGERVRWPWRMKSLAAMYAPAWTSRDFFLNVGTRAELLEDIDEPSAIAEGVEPLSKNGLLWKCYQGERCSQGERCRGLASARSSFGSLWDKLTGSSWAFDSNLPVWVITLWRFPSNEAEEIRKSLQRADE